MFYPKSPFLCNPLVESEILKRNSDALKELLPWLCCTPKITTYRLNLLRTTLAKELQHFEEYFADRFEKPPKVFTIPNIPEVICIGSIEPDIDEFNEHKDKKQIIVDISCGAALLRGALLYAPGVIGMETNIKSNELVNVFADLDGKCKKGSTARYESEQKVFIGFGRALMQRFQLFNSNAKVVPEGVAVEMKQTISGVPSIGDYSNAIMLLQNLPSIVCIRVLAPQPGECVLDMCAAPGNKTSHIVEMMKDEGIVVALDKAKQKVKSMQLKLGIYKYKSVKTQAYDSTQLYSANAEKSESADPSLPPYSRPLFDRILLDAPCSGLGNRPVLATKMTPKILESYPKVQRKLFMNAIPVLKPGGILVYSTCTITEAENEEIVAWVLEKFPEIELVEATPKFGGPGLANCGLTEEQRNFVQRFGPTNVVTEIDTIGFFIAKFRKRIA